MKSKSLILIAIALGCGLVASIGISQVMGRSQKAEVSGVQKVETTTVVVAVKDLDIGATFNQENVKVEKWPKENSPEGAIGDLEALQGKFPRVRVTRGQPIMQSMLMDSLDKKIIPEGYRVIPIKVSADTVSGLVLPGDRVDVLVLLKKSSEIKKTMVRTVLKDVRIFDVNSQTERIIEEGQARNVKTVSLLLTPSKVALLTLAHDMGKLRLSLRRHNDTLGGDYEDAEISELLGTTAENGSKELGKSFADFVNKRKTEVVPIAAPVAVEPFHKLKIITPSGTTEYAWTDVNKPPQVSELGMSGNSSTTPVLDIPALGPEAAVEPEDKPSEKKVDMPIEETSQTGEFEEIKFEQ